MTDEPEITSPVDLCAADGRLNPMAKGWSRRPLHRANLVGFEGRNKRWDYWAILAGDLVISAVYSDVDYLGLADVYWADLVTAEKGGHGIVVPAGQLALPEIPGSSSLRVDRDGLALEIVDDHLGTHLRGRWTEPDGRPGRLDVTVAEPPGHESLNVVIPWSDEVFNYTSKHQARPATGELVVGERRWPVAGGRGRGRMGCARRGSRPLAIRRHVELGRRGRALW